MKKINKPLPVNQIMWKARRGMLELDTLLAPFCRSHYNDLTDEEKLLLDHLLNQTDPFLLSALVYNPNEAPKTLQPLIHKIRTSYTSQG